MPKDLDDLLKRLDTPTEPPARRDGGDGAAAQAAPSDAKTDGGDGWLSSIGSGIASFGKEALKGAGAEIESGLELIPKYKGTGVAKWAREHTEADPEAGLAGRAGRFAGEILPWMAIPEVGLGGMAARAAGRFALKAVPNIVRGAKGQYVLNPKLESGIGQFLHQRLPEMARTAGRATEHAAIGAGAGAVEDPEHPIRGAAAGAVAGLTPVSLGALARSHIATHMASHFGRHKLAELGASAFIGHMMGLPFVPIVYPMIAWGPGGRMTRRIIYAVHDRTGRKIAEIPEAAVRAAAAGGGTAASSLFTPERSIGETQTPGLGPITTEAPGTPPGPGQSTPARIPSPPQEAQPVPEENQGTVQ